MHMSYGAFDRYSKCPERYRRQNVEGEWPDESRHWAVFGSVLQSVFEKFYSREMWRSPKTVRKDLEDLVSVEMRRYLAKNFVDWDAPFFDSDEMEVEDDIRYHVAPVLQAIKDYRLLGHRNVSELYLKAKIAEDDTIGGQVDFLIYRGDRVLIVDGKGGRGGPKARKTKGKYKYISKDQLLFYALTYFLKHRKLPTTLAFLWYRFWKKTDDGFDTSEMWDELVWDRNDILDLRTRVLAAMSGVRNGEFEATPKPGICRFCPFTKSGPGQCRGYADMRLSRKPRSETPFSDDHTFVMRRKEGES